MPGTRDLIIGRLALTSIDDTLAEAVGDALNSDDAGVAVARRRPRQFSFSVPVYGTPGDLDPYAIGMRMRRQLRGMMENSGLRLGGLYMSFLADPEINGWMVIGSGTIEYTAAGVSLANFKLSLDGAFRIGTQRSHREGRRIELYDRRLVTVPHDYYGNVFGTDFSTLTPPGTLVLPVGATDIVGVGRTVVTAGSRPGIDGAAPIVAGVQHGNILHFERAEVDRLKGQVVVLDRRGFTAPAQTLAGDTDPQTNYGWEEIYGPDHPLTSGDCVVLQNSHCRVRYVAATTSFAVDAYVAGTGFVERGRVTVFDSTATDVYNQHAYLVPQSGGALGTVLEYSFERAAIRVTSQRSSIDRTVRMDTVISLQRGWLGPRFETYASSSSFPAAGCQVRWTSNVAASLIRTTPSIAAGIGAYAADDALSPWADATGWTFGTLSEPWIYVQPVASGASVVGVVLASAQAAAYAPAYVDNVAYGGANRNSVAIAARYNVSQSSVTLVYGYASMHIGFDAPGTASVLEAETYINAGGTRTSVADAAASGGNAINDTQTTEAAATFSATAATLGMPVGKYGVWVRVRATTSGDMLSVRAALNGVAVGTPATTVLLTYTWLYVRDVTVAASTDAISVNVWRSAGVGSTGMRLDRVVLVPVERRDATNPSYDGARDVGAGALTDAQGVPELVQR